jgi:hypothetical protein
MGPSANLRIAGLLMTLMFEFTKRDVFSLFGVRRGGGFGLVAMGLGDTPPATTGQLAYYGFSNYDPED